MLCMGVLVVWCFISPPAPVDSFCALASPIYWAAADTRKTKEAIDLHNRKWKAACRRAAK